MDDEKVANRINEKKTRIQAKQELYERNAKVRAEAAAATKAHYLSAKDSPVILDILAKCKSFADFHTKVARDGVGYRQVEKDKEPEIYYLRSEKRLAELDRAAGILEIVDYIERQFRQLPEAAKPNVEAEESNAEPSNNGADEAVA